MTEDISKIESTIAPRRYLALWFPFLTTDRLHQRAERDDRPLVITEKIKGALRIIAVDQRATKLGLVPGLTLADARARVPDIAVGKADTKSDVIFLERLVDLCDRFTPSVALDLPDGLLLDIAGCAHRFNDEWTLRTQILSNFHRIGLSVRSSIAGTPEAARALARFSQVEIAPPGRDEFLVKQLPAAALHGLERETVVALSRAGLKTIGDLSERPPQILAARFGRSLVTSLMRTLGRENARITPLRPLPSVVIDRHFPEPFTQTEALENILASLLEDAGRIMQERDEGGRVFEASFFRSDGAVRRIVVQTGRASRDPATILRLYRELLDTLSDPIDPGFGFDCIRLAVPVTESLKATQILIADLHLDGETDKIDGVGDLVDRLVVRFGRDRVLRFAACDTHDPDHETRLVSAASDTSVIENRATTPPASCRPLCEAGEPPLRPLQLFASPQPIEALAEVPDGPPLRFRWRRVLHEVTRSEGPERIEPEWWRKRNGAPTRDYYRVEDAAGCRFWIFREGRYGQGNASPRWFLHGLFA